MPAEWARHESTWLTWPTNRTTWPGRLLAETQSIYLRMIAALTPGERVNLIVPDARTAARVSDRAEQAGVPASRLVCHVARTVDTWIRDYGPVFVKRGRAKAFNKFTFNAWGGKYADLARDNGVVNRLGALRSYRRFDVPVVLEGGSIDVDGEGHLLTTEQCLLNENRNPHWSRRSLEALLGRTLGVRRVIWLKEGIEGDDTDGHVDDITRFVGRNRILTAVETSGADKNRVYLSDNLRILREARSLSGKKFDILELPMPGRVGPPRSDSRWDRLPASYANFYVGNAAVLLPVYSHRNDRAAARVLSRCFPERRIVPIECTALVYGLGSIHCVTQQEPA